ncbi:hypothetical protein EV421DRAFT_1736880 [Armillaria borealis]|uniref:Uncharacterized protein n=1 Tax=Armillaria borealis TaxID=47425 RepID=A0AA39JGP7_9AGAR|nr:hypothetical protein EV421DRAFT_1736880 [Armillaria borealis]
MRLASWTRTTIITVLLRHSSGYAVPLSYHQLARDIRWEKEVTRSIEALEMEIDALQEKLSISTKRAANHEENIGQSANNLPFISCTNSGYAAEHAVKKRRTTDHREKRRVSVRIKKNRRQAVLVLPSSTEVLQLSEEVPSSQDEFKL